jgi:YgiT-type zinc finger domain-containing protein
VKCPICKQGQTAPGVTTVTFDRPGTTILVRDVPAQVCDSCGEAFVDSAVSASLLAQANDAARAGVQMEVRAYAAA